jgi:hypothetical protein
LCYRLRIASPLTLSEIRSMLPAGFAADVASPEDQRALRPSLPGAQTVATLRLGACACLLRFPRTGDDERHLRRRFGELGWSRDRIIAALEQHRRGQPPPGEPAAFRAALAAFVAEHARNAGPTLYLLTFGEGRPLVPPGAVEQRVGTAAVRGGPHTWLAEGVPVLVIP